jgi:hypothetical protein
MRKVKWGVIGCGGIADRRTIPGMMLAENAELVAVMDANGAAAEAVTAAKGSTEIADWMPDGGIYNVLKTKACDCIKKVQICCCALLLR